MNTNVATSPRFGKLECAVGVLTAVVLACVLGLMTTDFHLFAAADSPAANGAPDILQVEKHAERRVGRMPNKSEKINPSPATTQPSVPEKSILLVTESKVGPVSECKGEPVGNTKLKRTASQGEAQEPPEPAGAAAPLRNAPHPGFSPELASQDSIGKTVLTVAIIIALTIIAPLVLVHCLFGLLRRHSQHFGPLIRIEYVGAPPMGVGPFTVNSLGATGAVQEATPAALERNNQFGVGQAESAHAHTAKQFDLGPTFETQRQLKEQQAQRLEEAVLQQLFEDNLKLQAQIDLAKEQQQDAPSGENG
jgi:hypothetical protein